MVILFPSAGVPFERWVLDAKVFAVVTLSAALVEIATKLIKDVFSLEIEVIWKTIIRMIKRVQSWKTNSCFIFFLT